MSAGLVGGQRNDEGPAWNHALHAGDSASGDLDLERRQRRCEEPVIVVVDRDRLMWAQQLQQVGGFLTPC